jgi:hypothetical protein
LYQSEANIYVEGVRGWDFEVLAVGILVPPRGLETTMSRPIGGEGGPNLTRSAYSMKEIYVIVHITACTIEWS